MNKPKFVGLPVHGYKSQGQDAVQMVNINKQAEEAILRLMDEYAGHPDVDKRWLATARTDIERGFMALNRSIFKPGRIALPEDEDGA